MRSKQLAGASILNAIVVTLMLLTTIPDQQPPLVVPVLSPPMAEWLKANERAAHVAGTCERFFPDFEQALVKDLEPKVRAMGPWGQFVMVRLIASFNRGKTDPIRLERNKESCDAALSAAIAAVPPIEGRSDR